MKAVIREHSTFQQSSGWNLERACLKFYIILFYIYYSISISNLGHIKISIERLFLFGKMPFCLIFIFIQINYLSLYKNMIILNLSISMPSFAVFLPLSQTLLPSGVSLCHLDYHLRFKAFNFLYF